MWETFLSNHENWKNYYERENISVGGSEQSGVAVFEFMQDRLT